jgi:uncharacterized protein (TIGR03382 family)
VHRIHHNVFAGNEATDDGGAVYLLDTDAEFAHNHFVGNLTGDAGAAIAATGSDLTLTSNLFALNEGGEAIWPNQSTVSRVDYNLWFDTGAPIAGVSIGANDVEGDPLFQSHSDDGDWTNDDLRPGPGSPAVDAGDPLETDADGTRADIGAWGGADSLAGEGGTTPSTEPTGPSETQPPATEPTVPAEPPPPAVPPDGTGVDVEPDDGGPTSACGCSHDARPASMLPMLVLAAALRRRRAIRESSSS